MAPQTTDLKVSSAFLKRCFRLLLLPILPFVSIGFSESGNGTEQITAKIASKIDKGREKASLAEPTLFPTGIQDPVESMPAIRKAGNASPSDVDPVDSVNIGTSEFALRRSDAAFQTYGRNPAIEAAALGLTAVRERDAILARIQSDTSSQPYNIKIGRIPFRLAASLDLDFTDNFERSSQSRESELTILPRIDVSGSVKLAAKTTLSIGLGIGYIEYLNSSENDRLLTTASLSPDTGVSLDFKVGKFLISVYDRPLVPQFQADVATQRNQSQYSQFTNTAGLNIQWDVNSFTNSAFRYNHTNLISLKSEENTTDGVIDSFLVSLSFRLSESLGLGIQSGGDIRAYESALLNSGISYHIGTFANYNLSQYLHIQAGLGYQGGQYDSSGGVEDSSSLGTYYGNIAVVNSLNSRLSHSLSVGREAQRGAFSNFTVSNYVKYQTVWSIIDQVNLNSWASYEDIDESGGLFAQHFCYFSLGISCSLNLSSRIGLSLAYTLTKRTAFDDLQVRGGSLDFTENRISLHLGYAF